MTSSSLFHHPGDSMFTVVLTDDDSDGEDANLYDETRTEQSAWNRISSHCDDVSLLAATNQQRRVVYSSRGTSNITKGVENPSSTTPFSSPGNSLTSSNKVGDGSNERPRCGLLRCCSTNATSAFALLFLTVAAFPVHFPDGAFPSLRLTDDTQLRTVLMSATVGSILAAPCLDYYDMINLSPRRRHVFYRKSLVAGSISVVVVAFLRCIPEVPAFVFVVTGFAAGVGLTVVVRVTSTILLHVIDESDHVSGSWPSRDVTSLPSSEAAGRCLMRGVIATASLGAPLLTAGIASALLGPTLTPIADGFSRGPLSVSRTVVTTPQFTSVDGMFSPNGSNTNVSRIDAIDSMLYGTVDFAELRRVSTAATHSVSSVKDFRSSKFVNLTRESASVSFEATSSKHTAHPATTFGRQVATVACLFVGSVGALVLALFVVTDIPESATVDDGRRSHSLLRGTSFDDGAYEPDFNGIHSFREHVEHLLSGYGRREVVMLLVFALFVGSQQMMGYFVFIRSFIPIAAGTLTPLLAALCMATTSFLISTPIGFLIRYFGRVKLQLPVAILMPTCFIIVLVDAPWSRDVWAYYSIACLWAICDSCLHVTLSVSADHFSVTLFDNRHPINGILSASRSLGHLVIFILFSYCTSPDDDGIESVWNASKVCFACVLVLFVTAMLCFFAAEISLRLREPSSMVMRPRRRLSNDLTSRSDQTGYVFDTNSHNVSSSTVSSAPRESHRAACRYVAVVKHPEVDGVTNSWLPHIDPVISPNLELVKPLFGVDGKIVN